MNKSIVLLSLILAVVSSGNAQVFNPQSLKAEITNLEKIIKESKTDSDKYNGGMIKSIIDSRTQILTKTKNMLEQRLAAGNNNVKITYTIDGKAYVPPTNKDKLLLELEGTALAVTKELETAKGEADKYTGGLVKSMKLVTIATHEQQLAILAMKHSALVFDIPLYALVNNAATPAAAEKVSKTKKDSHVSPIDGMFDLKLDDKSFFKADFSSYLKLSFVFMNNTEKDIKAIKGTLMFTDLFDSEIKSISLTIEKDIPAGQSINNSDYSIELNQFSSEDNRLKIIEMENLKIKFNAESIIFKDGSIVAR